MRKHTRRKVWQLVNPIEHAILGAQITHQKSLDALQLRELSSLEAMTSGKGGIQEWSDLVAILNLCETMAKGGIGPEALEHCQIAEQDLQKAARAGDGKVMSLSIAGIKAIREVLAYHHMQRTSISRAEYERWIEKTHNRIKSKAPEVVEIA